MQLLTIRGGSKKALEDRKYSIGIGISLGNKWFTVENIVSLVHWALPFTRGHLVIYVADSIHAINVEVRNRVSFESAQRKVGRQGKEILEQTRKTLEEQLSKESVEKIKYFQWTDIADTEYQSKVEYLRNLYTNNNDFRNSILSIVKGFTSRENRSFTDENILRLGEYILEELPEIINRVRMGDVECDAYVYPFDGELPVFAEKIQMGEVFPEIKEAIMDTEPKVFLEVR